MESTLDLMQPDDGWLTRATNLSHARHDTEFASYSLDYASVVLPIYLSIHPSNYTFAVPVILERVVVIDGKEIAIRPTHTTNKLRKILQAERKENMRFRWISGPKGLSVTIAEYE
jgi:hypothetical protein